MDRSFFLRVVLVLLAVNAAVAIFALLGGDMGGTGAKIFFTSLLATMGAVLSLVCAPAASAGRGGWWPRAGMATAGGSVALFIFGTWAEPGDAFFKAAGTILVIAVVSALISVLSAWPGAGKLTWVRTAATVLAAIAGGFGITLIWMEGDVPETYGRLSGIVMVLLAAASIATPVVHRMSTETIPEPDSWCPFCGATVNGTVGETTTCLSCGRKYEVELR